MQALRTRRDAISRNPAPYMMDAISRLSPLSMHGTALTSSRIKTTGYRFGFRARMRPSSDPTSQLIIDLCIDN
jgi:hypothetical protein